MRHDDKARHKCKQHRHASLGVICARIHSYGLVLFPPNKTRCAENTSRPAKRFDVICYDSDSVSFGALFKSWVKTSFQEDELSPSGPLLGSSKHLYQHTFSFTHPSHPLPWRLSVSIVVGTSFFWTRFFSPCSYVVFYFILLDLDFLSLCLYSFRVYGPSVIVLCSTVCSCAASVQPQNQIPLVVILSSRQFLLSISFCSFLCSLWTKCFFKQFLPRAFKFLFR